MGDGSSSRGTPEEEDRGRTLTDLYISADVETDGPIPGMFSMLSFALVPVGSFDGSRFVREDPQRDPFYCELRPISERFQRDALAVNGLDRDRLLREGLAPTQAMDDAYRWVQKVADGRKPILIAYPLSFDWTFLYWYFTAFAEHGSPFGFSGCLDIKTAYAIKAGVPIAISSKSRRPRFLRSDRAHTHNALDDAIEQADLFTKLFEWDPRSDEPVTSGRPVLSARQALMRCTTSCVSSRRVARVLCCDTC